MMSFPIPVVTYRPDFGPGSQPQDDEILNTLDVQGDVLTFRPPLTELDAAPEVVAAAMDFLRMLLVALRATPFGAPRPVRFSLLQFAPAVRDQINELLGEGEVSVQTGIDLRAQETAFTGIWRIRGAGVDDVEASAFPAALRDLALARAFPSVAAAPAVPPPDLMNAPALYHEIRSLSAQWSAGRAAHVAAHFFHARAGLQRDAAGVEADALADEDDRILTRLAEQDRRADAVVGERAAERALARLAGRRLGRRHEVVPHVADAQLTQ